jgi:hypothetical protein
LFNLYKLLFLITWGVEVFAREMIRKLHDVETETFLVAPTDPSEGQRQALPGFKGTFFWNP